MTDCNREPLLFSSLGRQEIVADFNGGRLTSDAGGLLLRKADRRLGLTRKLAACIPDPRHPLLVIHEQETMLAQRVFGIALGYEDRNDHDTLRTDPLFAVLADKKPEADGVEGDRGGSCPRLDHPPEAAEGGRSGGDLRASGGLSLGQQLPIANPLPTNREASRTPMTR